MTHENLFVLCCSNRLKFGVLGGRGYGILSRVDAEPENDYFTNSNVVSKFTFSMFFWYKYSPCIFLTWIFIFWSFSDNTQTIAYMITYGLSAAARFVYDKKVQIIILALTLVSISLYSFKSFITFFLV